jgi:predicted nucleic acid-binding protein
VIVDTSVWIDHLRRGNRQLVARLGRGIILCHPLVIGELACGNLRNREVLDLLAALPSATMADHEEALVLVETHRLAGRGLGWVDVHLLASTLLSRVPLWTFDRRLHGVAAELGVAK